nr:glycoside hydrolase family 99-like domain-containing protein [uncultured Butyrivibrio sp.]
MANSPKVLAMYLPQFHRTPENDAWWGEGFTDWVSARNAKPLFDGHYQPHIPLNENYYDLLEKNTMVWQADLMHQYGVDGICMYHYWFEDGRRILEKPEQNLLKWKDIDMPFCFCWANESWARSWSNISKNANSWVDTAESNSNADDDGVLLLQDYGGPLEWKAHFKYLAQFFVDDRYIKVDGKPLIVIYRVDDIVCIREMLELWRDMSYEYGFPGIYVIGGECRSNLEGIIDGQLFRQPARTMTRLGIGSASNDETPKRIRYDLFCEDMLRVQSEYKIQPYFCGITGFDTTPRKGKNGMVIENSTPKLFGKTMLGLMKKSASYGSNIVFVNAWNEWGEGMHLEPDCADGYGYLEEISKAKIEFESQDENSSDSLLQGAYEEYRKLFDKYQRANANINILSRWFEYTSSGGKLSSTISSRGWRTFAIYGYGVLGKELIVVLGNEGYEPSYIVENSSSGNGTTKVRIIAHREQLEAVDGIIITAVSNFEQIKERLIKEKFTGEIVSARDLIQL